MLRPFSALLAATAAVSAVQITPHSNDGGPLNLAQWSWDDTNGHVEVTDAAAFQVW